MWPEILRTENVIYQILEISKKPCIPAIDKVILCGTPGF
jgi:hypothetical protein